MQKQTSNSRKTWLGLQTFMQLLLFLSLQAVQLLHNTLKKQVEV